MAEPGGTINPIASRASGDAESMTPSYGPHRILRAGLGQYLIFMIAFSGTVGTGIFINSGEAMRIAGPGGALIAFSVVALTATTSMDGHAEMIALWPIANAKVKFVRCFVDEDLAVVVGIAYWYTYAVGFASIVTTTVALAEYWHPSNAILVAFPLVLGPICVIALNFLNVKWFGVVACIGGGLVAILVLGAFILMLCINRGVGGGDVIGTTYFDDGVQMDPDVVFSRAAAVCAVIPIAAYAFVGIEIVSAAAIEVQRPQINLPAAANWIAPVTSLLYLLLLLTFCFNVHWRDPGLPPFYGISSKEPQNVLQRKDADYAPSSGITIKSVLVIAVNQAGMPELGEFLMAALIFAAYNTALVALYVASRTIHGITRDMGFKSDYRIKDWIAYLGVTNRHRVPSVAIVVSAALFGSWLPALHFARRHPTIIDILSTIGASGCVFVWASQCLSFIRYRKWLKKHSRDLKDGEYRKYNLWLKDNESIKYRSLLEAQNLQPFAAWVGLILNFLILFIVSTASWWNRALTPTKFFAAYAGPIALLLFFAILKTRHRFWRERGGFVQLEHNWATLIRVLDALDERNSENSPENSRRPTDNENVPLGPIHNEISRQNTGANADPQAVT